jgi:hypothetical protein
MLMDLLIGFGVSIVISLVIGWFIGNASEL